MDDGRGARTHVGARVGGMLAATHPAPAAVVTALALVFAVGVGLSAGRAVLVTAAVAAGQLSIGWSNDWLDAGRDRRAARADKPTVTGAVTAGALRAGALAALAVCVLLSLATGVVPGLLHLAAVAGGWSYNAWLKGTAWSWLPYATSFGLLPAFVVAAAGDGRVVAGWTVLAAALLGVGAHVANVLPDLEDDHATGIRGLPHRLGRRGSSVLAPVVLAAGSVVVLLGPAGAPGIATAVLTGVALVLAGGAGVIGVLRPHSRAPFALSMAVAAVCVAQLVLAAGAVAVPA
ncbi:UbiA family prenyltransferase [Isoptericola sp. NEAU-Y5]|uniref:UbiA family prenyltransferase n=1 Tax=Isoptericola luteus TaxID=2879484 RepID=A0ABS7ZME8_9MICO|nr:UbiA family prenyltransferase [Isoptericola sp. NEAU-Y5]MCA5895054.1 UbiA family prenyltransferase [Isoptericola sp. NEAU-Y5]